MRWDLIFNIYLFVLNTLPVHVLPSSPPKKNMKMKAFETVVTKEKKRIWTSQLVLVFLVFFGFT